MPVAALVLALLDPSGCVLDQAHVVAVPPATVQVLATWDCGGIRCWERWTEVDGRRVLTSRACESRSAGDRVEVRP